MKFAITPPRRAARTSPRHTRRGRTATGPPPRRSADGPGVPDADPLVRPLGQYLPGDRGDERRRREVRQRARVVAVEGVRRDPRAEVVEHGIERLRIARRAGGPPASPKYTRRSSSKPVGVPIARTIASSYSQSRLAAQVAAPARSRAARDVAASRIPISSGSGCQRNPSSGSSCRQPSRRWYRAATRASCRLGLPGSTWSSLPSSGSAGWFWSVATGHASAVAAMAMTRCVCGSAQSTAAVPRSVTLAHESTDHDSRSAPPRHRQAPARARRSWRARSADRACPPRC